MIIPFIFGVSSFRMAPVTWLLCLLNCLFFVVTLNGSLNSQDQMSRLLDDEMFISTQAYAFAHFILDNDREYSEVMKELAKGTLAGSKKKAKFLGSLALRDYQFVRQGTKLNLTGDQIAIKKWRTQARALANTRVDNPTTKWGLSSFSNHLEQFLTYQFMHGDVFHLLSNMFFLLIFGVALEPIIGAAGLLAVYLIGGIVAGEAFSLISGLSALPLIGASGSVSALMGIFAALYRTKPVRFFFWVLPTKNYFGFIFLPAWVAVAMWVCMDFAGLIGTLPELGGTAHSAHLGGVTFGFIVGFVAYILNQRRFRPVESSLVE